MDIKFTNGKSSVSPLMQSMFISTAAMNAQNQRVLLLSQNIANAGVKAQPGKDVYKRQIPTFESKYNPQADTNLLRIQKVHKVKDDPIKNYSPGDPYADADGFTREPNISASLEMMDMREASRSHEAALRCFERIMLMFQNTISVLKN